MSNRQKIMRQQQQQQITPEQFLIKQMEQLEVASGVKRRADNLYADIIANYKGVCKSLMAQNEQISKELETLKEKDKNGKSSKKTNTKVRR